mgnify:CR=1 FL=1
MKTPKKPSEVKVVAMAMHAAWLSTIGPNPPSVCIKEAVRHGGGCWEKQARALLHEIRRST